MRNVSTTECIYTNNGNFNSTEKLLFKNFLSLRYIENSDITVRVKQLKLLRFTNNKFILPLQLLDTTTSNLRSGPPPWFRTWTRFETETKGNSEIAYITPVFQNNRKLRN